MRRKSWMKWWSVLRLAACRACSICSRRLRRFILCWSRWSRKVGKRSSNAVTAKGVNLDGERLWPFCSGPWVADLSDMDKNAREGRCVKGGG